MEFLQNLDPNHTAFAVIDFLVYVLEFGIGLQLIHRVLIPLIAKHEADDELAKTFLTLVCTGIGAAILYKYLSPVNLMYLHPIAVGLLMVLLFKYLMWMTYKTSVIATVCCAVLFSVFVLLNTQVINRFLPEERNTFFKQVGLYSELMDETEISEDAELFSKESFLAMRRNLKLQKEAWSLALQILEDPDYISDLTAEHNARLELMGLLAEKGEMPSAEELEALGIRYEAQEQAVAFRKMWATGEADPRKILEDGLSYEDMNTVVSMLQEAGGEGEEVTYYDAAVLFQSSITNSIMSHDAAPTEDVKADLESLSSILEKDIPAEDQSEEENKEAQKIQSFQNLIARFDSTSEQQQDAAVSLRDISLVMDLLQTVRGEGVKVTSKDAGVVMQNLIRQSILDANANVTAQHKEELLLLDQFLEEDPEGEGQEAVLEEVTEPGPHELDPELKAAFRGMMLQTREELTEADLLSVSSDEMTLLVDVLQAIRPRVVVTQPEASASSSRGTRSPTEEDEPETIPADVSPQDAALVMQSLLMLSRMTAQGFDRDDAASILVDALEEFDVFFRNGFRVYSPEMNEIHLSIMGITSPSTEGTPYQLAPLQFSNNVMDPYLAEHPHLNYAKHMESLIGSKGEGDPEDPFRDLPPEERKAWLESMSFLDVSAVIRNARGRESAIVNNKVVSPGGMVSVEMNGETYRWRMSGMSENDVLWEPVLDQEEQLLIVF